MNKFQRTSKPIRDLVQSEGIDGMSRALTEGTKGLHQTIPNIAQSLQVTGSRALGYLHSKLPQAMSELPGDPAFEPSKSHQRAWLDLHGLVDDPLKVLDHVRHGSLTKDHMDAMTQVHPELLDDMRQKVMEHMSPDKVRSLPTSTKAALGLFLGTPISQSLMPQSILLNQQTFMQNKPMPQQGTAVKSTVSGMKELNLAERSSTEVQELEEPK